MARKRLPIHTDDLDGLRLLALSRIPRCGTCPRFMALVDAHALPGRVRGKLPPAPAYCSHQVCAPLATRWNRREGDEAENGRLDPIRLSAC